ncbi:MAG: hypothetical protein WD801_06100 [Gemmatimonadaceae bacterium]
MMNRKDLGNGLELHYHDVINEHVEAIPGVDPHSVILDWERKLRLYFAPPHAKLVRKAGCIGAFEQTGSERRVNLECRVHYIAGALVDEHLLRVSWRMNQPRWTR